MNLISPYGDGVSGPWYRGNLHTHTTASDGQLTLDEVVAQYAGWGYDFLAITDHDLATPPFAHDHLVALPGDEVSRGGPHLLAVGIEKAYATDRDRAEIIAEIVADGALCVLNHPNWGARFEHWPQTALEAIEGYHGIEIYNGVIEFLEGEPYALDRWDQLLSRGRRVWGYANDDFHFPFPLGEPLGWNWVAADARTPEAIVAALKAGRCYASTGVTLETIALEGQRLTVAAADADHVRFIGRHGVVLQAVDGAEAGYTIQGSEGYVRAEVYGAGRRAAFTQPVFVEEA